MASLPPSHISVQRRKRGLEVTPSPEMHCAASKKKSKRSSDIAPVVENLMTRLETGDNGMPSCRATQEALTKVVKQSSVVQKDPSVVEETATAATSGAASGSTDTDVNVTNSTRDEEPSTSNVARAPIDNFEELSGAASRSTHFVESVSIPNSDNIRHSVLEMMRTQKMTAGEKMEDSHSDTDESFVSVMEEESESMPEMTKTRTHRDALDALRRPMCSHRVEVIVDGGGIPVLSPILEMVVLAGAVVAFRPLLTGAGTMLNVEYFFESVCPIVQRIRRMVFRVDHALYPLLRGTLGAWCDTEDAFVKTFTDVWVRGVLTSTDSFALLIMKAPATIGALFVVLAIAPLLAIPYAIVATVVRLLELLLFHNWMITRILARLIRWTSFFAWLPCRIAGWVCRSTVLGLVMDNDYRQHFHRRVKIPPKTGHRLRPTPSDGIEDISLGAFTRITRIFWYFHRKARRAIIGAIVTAVFLAVLVRVTLLSMPRCGSGILSPTAQQEMWTMLSTSEEEVGETAPQCISVHALARKLAKKIGVETPDFDSLGDEGFVLARLQEATDDDYIDLTLRRACRSVGRHFIMYPVFVRVGVLSVLLVLVFAGILRRVAFWADLKRRYRYRHLRDSIVRNASLGSENASDDDSGGNVDDKGKGPLVAGGTNYNKADRNSSNVHSNTVHQLSIPRLMKIKMKMKKSKLCISKST